MHACDQSEGVRPDKHPRDDEAGQHRKPETMEDENDDERHREDHGEVFEDDELLHGYATPANVVAIMAV